MKKPNLIIGKKQIILASLTLILGIAIYVNYVLSQQGNELKATGVLNGVGANYGDVQYVDGDETGYFAQARIDKMTARDEAVETLQIILSGGDTTADEQAMATKDAVALSQLIESEGVVENLIKAAGFADCVVYLDGTSANIVVKSEGLIASEAAQIKDILLNEVSVAKENIRIYDVK